MKSQLLLAWQNGFFETQSFATDEAPTVRWSTFAPRSASSATTRKAKFSFKMRSRSQLACSPWRTRGLRPPICGMVRLALWPRHFS
jgi:hypothetical protein